ncbi:MAG: hypothetical protein JRJ59_02330, partial [Deltaproteobacteria bacterium]|nr:hypothetical protein [Deltaproteobacteria bacterium]
MNLAAIRARLGPRRKPLALAAAGLVLVLAVLLRPTWRAVPVGEPRGSLEVIGPFVLGTEADYRFKAPARPLVGLDLRWATYGRTNQSTIHLELRPAGSDRLLAFRAFEASAVGDWDYWVWRFDPISSPPGQELVLTLKTPDATPETCLALLATSEASPETVSFEINGQKRSGALPVKIIVAQPVPVWASPWVWLGLLLALGLAWLLWPARQPQPARPETRPAPALTRPTLIVALAATLAVSFICGWPNIVAKRKAEAVGYFYQPTPGDENWYAELAHKFSLGRRVLVGDPQVFEADDVVTPFMGVFLSLGLLGLGDKLLGPTLLGYVIDFLLPALMVALLFLGARLLGASLGQALVMALGLAAFPHLAPFYMIGAKTLGGAWDLLLKHLSTSGTYFTSMGHPQMSGFFAVLAGLLLWRAFGRGGWWWVLASGLGLGLLFYADLYFHHFLIGTAGLLVPISLLRRDWLRFKRSLAIIGLTLLVGGPYWVQTYLYFKQPWAKQSVLENADFTPPFSFLLQRFEINTLWLVAVLVIVYAFLILKRRFSPSHRAAAPDWVLDLTFASVLAFVILFFADEATGINAQKHH